jgi:hypothetical protein
MRVEMMNNEIGIINFFIVINWFIM